MSTNNINRKIAVLSGKGGVGKSTCAVNLAVTAAGLGKKVGLLDIDIHGPSVPKLLGISRGIVKEGQDMLVPVDYSENLKVMSIGFLIEKESDPIIWRGPLKANMIKKFVEETIWGDLDFLFIDCPPGTGDEPLSIFQLLNGVTGAVIVTTPQDVALLDVKKSITFCNVIKAEIIGLIENMSGFICPHCKEKIDIFKVGGGKNLAEEMNIPYLGSIPIEPEIVQSGDQGKPFVVLNKKNSITEIFKDIIEIIEKNETIGKIEKLEQ